ncbi:hypothetical protein Dsin_012839 [Dipteronia sinensis]|uniref:Uncharacterized protein n=1 Tax=Dipteronia sinensis TaxID=43782 RepID=A0AAE0AK16_9ROSI|nr:hypothetical protein Dsin_012839 [Dipteronia sinensis]
MCLGPRPSINGLAFKQLSNLQKESLGEPFSEEEVWKALKDCDGNKAPRPDFFKSNWEEIKVDFMDFINEFYKETSIVKDVNRTFIALIPKLEDRWP